MAKQLSTAICSLKQPIEVGSISTYLDPVYKFLNGLKLARVLLSFTRCPQNRARFLAANINTICNRICIRVPCKRPVAAQVNNSFVPEKFVRARVNAPHDYLRINFVQKQRFNICGKVISALKINSFSFFGNSLLMNSELKN